MGDKKSVYTGSYVNGRCVVHCPDGRRLPTYYGRRGVTHSPDGFQWGYGGSGPAQLAYAILRHRKGAGVAHKFYQAFKWQVVCRWKQPPEGWELEASFVDQWVEHAYQGREYVGTIHGIPAYSDPTMPEGSIMLTGGQGGTPSK